MKPPSKFSWLQSESIQRNTQLFVGVIAIGLLFWKLQFSTDSICCGDFDGYYHIKWTRTLWDSIKSGHLVPAFPWLPLTTLNSKDYVDHHFLFHLLQIPFARFENVRVGAKVASIVFGSLAVISCYWLLVRYRVKYLFVWLIALLACSAPFLFRMNMAKAPPLTIVYLIIATHFFFKKKYWPLLPLALVFTWTYDMFVLLAVAVIAWVLSIAWSERRFEWRPLVYVFGGVALGLILNPYFPHNLQLLWEHARMKLVVAEFNTKVGSEWYPYDSWEFLGNSVVACISMVVGYIAFDPSERKRSHYSLYFLVISTVLLIMTARWKRIAEYWPPFAVLFAAFSLQPWLEGARSALTKLPNDVLDELQPFLDRDDSYEAANDSGHWEIVRTTIVSCIALILSGVLFFNLSAAKDEIKGSEPHDHYRVGASWLRTKVPPGQIIFNTDWDDFPRLFYYDSTHYYVSGLDPSYLFDKNPELSRLYDRITLGQEENPGPLIRDRFGARYVFSDNSHHDFFAAARSSGWFDIVYEDGDCTIMYIRDEKKTTEGEADPTNVDDLFDDQPTGMSEPK